MQFRSELNKSRIPFVLKEFLEPPFKRFVLKSLFEKSESVFERGYFGKNALKTDDFAPQMTKQ